jgi:formylglycine-generating enzyme required for sulfatase activity
VALRALAVSLALAASASCAPSCSRESARPWSSPADGAAVTALSNRQEDDGEDIEIPGGSFAMGSDEQGTPDNERPVHLVTVATFRLDRTEVSVAAYGACVRAGACSEPDAYRHERGTRRIFCNWKHPEGRATHPINCVDHSQAEAYCAWLGKRLPTEQEWEHAARGGEGRRYPWGDEAPNETRLNACATECPANAVAKGLTGWPPMHPASDRWPETAPVGSFPRGASKHGVLDLAGNVWEWTASGYERYDGQVDQNTPAWKRVLRGGSWGGSDMRTERTTNRFALDPSSRAQFLGFRCARGK